MRANFILLIILIIHKINAKLNENFVVSTLETQWLDTPVTFEASEFFNEENKAFYWDYLEGINTIALKNGYHNLTSQFNEYSMALEKAEEIFQNNIDAIKIFKFALSLRLYSPKIEMFNQIYKSDISAHTCESMFYVKVKENDFICSLTDENLLDIKHHLSPIHNHSRTESSEETVIYKSVDHRYISPHHVPSLSSNQNNNTAELAKIVLYSDFRTLHFKHNHAILKNLAIKGKIEYYFRPVFDNPYLLSAQPNENIFDQYGRKTFLSGFGIELAIKNTEYKAKDDTKIKDMTPNELQRLAYQQGILSDDKIHHLDDQIIQGLNFTTIRENYPDMTTKLDNIEGSMVQDNAELKMLKGWELQDLSFQAAHIINTRALTFDSRLKLMRDLSQNFPTRAPSLINITVDADFRKEIVRNQYLLEGYNLPKGESLFYINRMPIDMDTFSIYEVFHTMKKEMKAMSVLGEYGLRGNDMLEMLATKVELKEEEIALDFKNTNAIKYINDLETDSKYARWSRTLSVLEQTFWFGMVTEIRKNLFNAILIISPLQVILDQFKFTNNNNSTDNACPTLELLKDFKMFYQTEQPYHLGLVLVHQPKSSTKDMDISTSSTTDEMDPALFDDHALLLQAAFNYIYQTAKEKIDALDFLIAV